MSVSRSEAVRKYFTKTPSEPEEPLYYDSEKYKNGFIVGGGLIFLALLLILSGNGSLIFLGFVAGYFGFRSLKKSLSNSSEAKKRLEAKRKDYERACIKYKEAYARAEPKPTDEQMDKWMSSDIEKIIGEALRRLDLEHEDYRARPLLIGGPALLEETSLAPPGRDGKTRYSHFHVLVVFLTDYHIAAYECDSSMEYGQILTDKTQEFPYKEITNLGTQIVKTNIRLLDEAVEFESGIQEFTLETSGANVIRVPYQFARNTDFRGELVKIGGEDTITAIRKKLQDYKQKYER